MDIKELKEVIGGYVSTNEPGYAIMINGAWGCGKTRFIKDYFSECHSKHIYISLYGVSSLEEIEDKIFSCVTSLDGVSEDAIQKAGGFLGKVASLFEGVGDHSSALGAVASTVGSTIKARFLKGLSSEFTLVFDDLERASMNESGALACVNEFVEHQGLKAILICDESKIADRNYGRYKEKVVLYTYHINRSIESTVEVAFSDQEELTGRILNDSKEELSLLLEAVKCKNLRTIRLAVSSYVALVNSYLSGGQSDEDIRLTRLLSPCLAYAVGYRELKLDIDELAGYASSSLNMGLSFHAKKELSGDAEEQTPSEEFYEKVAAKTRYSIEMKSPYKLVCRGQLDYDELCKDVAKWNPVEDDPKLNIIHSNYNFNDGGFEEMILSAISGVRDKTFEFSSTQELIRFISNLHFLVRKEAVDYDIGTLEYELDVFVGDVLTKKVYGDPQLRFGASDEDHDFVKNAWGRIHDYVSQKKEEDDVKELQDSLMTVLRSTDEAKIQKAYQELNHGTSKPIFLLDFDKKVFEALLFASPMKLDEFSRVLRSRYSASNIFSYLGNEIPSLEKLKLRLEKSLGNIKPSLSKFHLVQLASFLKNILPKPDEG